MTDIRWTDPWCSIEGEPQLQESLNAELQKELPTGHVLTGLRARAVGRRVDNDDVLYALDSGEPRYAVVHLTWRMASERDPAWPGSAVFADEAELMARCIEPDSAEFRARQHE